MDFWTFGLFWVFGEKIDMKKKIVLNFKIYVIYTKERQMIVVKINSDDLHRMCFEQKQNQNEIKYDFNTQNDQNTKNN